MRTFNIVVERCPDSGFYIGHVPGFPGAHSQGETREELRTNMQEVIEMLLEEGEPEGLGEFTAVEEITVG